MQVQSRFVPQRDMAVIGREVLQPELEGFIRWAFTEIFDRLADAGYRTNGTTRDEPTYVIFHGPVTPDQSALVEVCVPFVGNVEDQGEITTKTEPEHHEAYLTVTKAGLDFPAILESYDAVAAWVNEHGEMLEELPSREVYVTEVPQAGPDDEVCDITFPYRPAD
ncbi:GyrI-like domain-containing protein [Demequina aurantiaca]|uniref:GyrI-like domain-containing protein n=1 Tax=Demequina aurantiaca TaxID=676200 RepID=UPI0009FECA8E|nr:GyrI-like domain-containing protein [Demequina aurantiaca]